MLKFWSVINCIFVHWTNKLTLGQVLKFLTVFLSNIFWLITKLGKKTRESSEFVVSELVVGYDEQYKDGKLSSREWLKVLKIRSAQNYQGE